MIFAASATATLAQLILVGAALVGAGWTIATTWHVLRLTRSRYRNLRIVADLRRLTDWLEPATMSEPRGYRPRHAARP